MSFHTLQAHNGTWKRKIGLEQVNCQHSRLGVSSGILCSRDVAIGFSVQCERRGYG